MDYLLRAAKVLDHAKAIGKLMNEEKYAEDIILLRRVLNDGENEASPGNTAALRWAALSLERAASTPGEHWTERVPLGEPIDVKAWLLHPLVPEDAKERVRAAGHGPTEGGPGNNYRLMQAQILIEVAHEAVFA